MDTFDVAIVGAGIGGSLCARELTRKKKRVILIESQQQYPRSKDSLATQYENIRDFKLPKSVILNKGSRLTYRCYPELEVCGSFTARQAGFKGGVILHCNKFIQDNIEYAAKKGCVFKINEQVASIKMEGGYYLLKLKSEDYSFKAKIIVDASGSACSIGELMGVHKQKYPVGYAAMILTEGDHLKNGGEAFFDLESFDKWFWLYPVSKTKAYVGLYTMEKVSYNDFVREIHKYMAKHGRAYFNTHFDSEYGVTMLNQYCPIKGGNFVIGNTVFLGDSGGMTTPLLLEGFRPICRVVSWLSRNIDSVLAGKKKLGQLNDYFFKTVGRYYPVMRAIIPFLIAFDHQQTRRVMLAYFTKLTPKKLYSFTTLDLELSDWRELIMAVSGALSRYEKIKIALRRPFDVMHMINVLKEYKLIKSVYELL